MLLNFARFVCLGTLLAVQAFASEDIITHPLPSL